MRIEVFSELPQDGKALREDVFMKEQGFSYDADEWDAEAAHLVGYDEADTPVGVCRFYRDREEPTAFIIGRLAVAKDSRGAGKGADMLRAAEDIIRVMGGEVTKLAAQLQAKAFYERLGYEVSGEPFDEDGTMHVWMKKVGM